MPEVQRLFNVTMGLLVLACVQHAFLLATGIAPAVFWLTAVLPWGVCFCVLVWKLFREKCNVADRLELPVTVAKRHRVLTMQASWTGLTLAAGVSLWLVISDGWACWLWTYLAAVTSFQLSWDFLLWCRARWWLGELNKQLKALNALEAHTVSRFVEMHRNTYYVLFDGRLVQLTEPSEPPPLQQPSGDTQG